MFASVNSPHQQQHNLSSYSYNHRIRYKRALSAPNKRKYPATTQSTTNEDVVHCVEGANVERQASHPSSKPLVNAPKQTRRIYEPLHLYESTDSRFSFTPLSPYATNSPDHTLISSSLASDHNDDRVDPCEHEGYFSRHRALSATRGAFVGSRIRPLLASAITVNEIEKKSAMNRLRLRYTASANRQEIVDCIAEADEVLQRLPRASALIENSSCRTSRTKLLYEMKVRYQGTAGCFVPDVTTQQSYWEAEQNIREVKKSDLMEFLEKCEQGTSSLSPSKPLDWQLRERRFRRYTRFHPTDFKVLTSQSTDTSMIASDLDEHTERPSIDHQAPASTNDVASTLSEGSDQSLLDENIYFPVTVNLHKASTKQLSHKRNISSATSNANSCGSVPSVLNPIKPP